MKIYFTFLFVFFPFFARPQQDLRIFFENKSQGYILYASNSTVCPLTILLDLSLENLSFSGGEQKFFVIPQKTIKMKLGELNILDRREKNKFSYLYKSYFGNCNLNKYDTAYEYDLPYQKGKAFLVSQGYNGQFTHQNVNALDFSMPEGTPILAAREGIVIQTIQDNTEFCPREECKKFSNHVIIYHPDGTFGQYGHIRYNGAMVNIGDSVKKGDLIAYSGNTGWSSGPHLHFACVLPPLMENQKTVTTKFRIKEGMEAVFLQEKETYLKGY